MKKTLKEVTAVDRKNFSVVILTFILILVFSSLAGAAEGERDKGYYRIITGKDKVLLETSLKVGVGDSFIDDKDNEYKITNIQGDKALAQLKKKAKEISALERFSQNLTAEVSRFGLAIAQGTNRPIAIYHTHSDESYQPTDGNFSIRAKGGIFKVGAALADGYRRAGANVFHSYNVHDPHDGMAYERSRRTVVQLLQKRPATLLDVHRDAAPPNAYRRVVNGQTIAQMIFVIGNQNPNYQANLAYAKQLRDAANTKYPGLSKGILVTGGRFNQDLTPKDILLEFGAHTNTRQSAERAAAMFANATASAITGTTTRTGAGTTNRTTPTPPPREAARQNSAGVGNAMLWILGLAIVGGAFLLMNEGSMEGIKARFRHFKNAEFANFLGLKKKKDDEK